MPVSFKVAQHGANPIYGAITCPPAEKLLADTWGQKSRVRGVELLQSSFPGPRPDPFIMPQSNGFVDTIIQAYSYHQHLILRPDDIWIAILGQFSFYVNANAESLRSHFVAHEEQKELTIVQATGNRYNADYGALANQMSHLIHENVVDKTLKNWILPDFTTTSHNDTVVCSVLMMSTMKAYFSYAIMFGCGLPSVTLEGEKEDWEKLLARLDKFTSFGAEPSAWVNLLRPILRRFVNAFDGEPDIDFWGRVCHRIVGGSRPGSISGWITAFCVWDQKGQWRGPNISGSLPTPGNVIDRDGSYYLVLDGIQYAKIGDRAVPVGFCEVDVKLIDEGQEFPSMMVAGHMGTRVQNNEKDTVRPLPAWFMFIKPAGST